MRLTQMRLGGTGKFGNVYYFVLVVGARFRGVQHAQMQVTLVLHIEFCNMLNFLFSAVFQRKISFCAWNLKGIFSDFNKIILWHKSTDIKKKRLFPKFQLILIFRLQVMHDYVH